jgi:hypothetical protein
MLALALTLAMAAPAGAPVIDPVVTPSKSLAAPRASAPVDDTCDEPVLLVITEPAADFSAVANGGRLTQLGGYELASRKPLDVLAGAPSGQSAALFRFPCRANALAFWSARPKGTSESPGMTAAIYPQVPLRPDMVGKVGDDSYSAAFGTAETTQTPAAGP